MKNIKIFSSVAEYENAKSEGLLITPNISFINELGSIKCLPKLEDPYNGYEYVDLGLPSGLKWATCNVGANSPEQAGLYFAWGETTGYTGEQVENGERVFDEASYNAGPAASISADLTLEQNVAHANLGGNWRMPTKAEFQELLDNCDVTWTYDYNETLVRGDIFTSRINGNSIFLPATGRCYNSSMDAVDLFGFYWAASWYSSSNTWALGFYSGNNVLGYFDRYYGLSVRGVCE